jgi:hypothetical protein
MTTAKLFQEMEKFAFDKLECPSHVKRFIKTMLIEHPEESACNTIFNSDEFQAMRMLIRSSKKLEKNHLMPLINGSGKESEFFIDYEYHQGEL